MIKSFTIIYESDLYRFFIEDNGDVVAVLYYPLMGTQSETLDYSEVCEEVRNLFETKYLT